MHNITRNPDEPLEKGFEMNDKLEKLIEEVKKLTPDERIKLIKEIFYSIDNERSQIDDAWAAEAESRLDAYEAGLIEGMPVDKVFEEIEKKDE